jgi:hypothetical protein
MLYNTPDTIYHRTAQRLKRQASQMIEEAKKLEASLVFSKERTGKTLDMRELEPIEGWEYSTDPWPGRAVREMSPLSDIEDDEVARLERELVNARKEINEDDESLEAVKHVHRRGWRSRPRGRIVQATVQGRGRGRYVRHRRI